MHDDRLLTGHDQYDLAMRIDAAGGESWLEPAATVYYDRPREVDRADRDFYFLRWSRAWDARTLDRWAEAWQLDPDDPDRAFTVHWHGYQRRLGYLPVVTWRDRWQHKRRALADSTVEARAVRWDRDRRRAAGATFEQAAPARIAHAPAWAPASADEATTY
jgi:hypothetical protein